jgi:hypothetical protein
MMVIMKQRFLAWCFGALALLASPVLALAEDEPVYYAKLEGYTKPVKLEGGSVTLTWLLLVLLAGICVLVLFKDAKRTHLD